MNGSVIDRTPSARLLPAAHYRTMPWRNGRGTTTEVALSAGTHSRVAGGRFLWRVSIADVPESGPFSTFPGYERIIAIVAGTGIELAVAGKGERGAAPVRLDQASAPFTFPGDAATDCRLIGGPIRDFNLILDRATTTGALSRLRLSRTPCSVPLAADTALLYALAGDLTVDAGKLGAWAVLAGDTLRLDRAAGPISIVANGAGHALLAAINPRANALG